MGDNTKSYRGRTVIILSRDAALARAARGENSTSQYHCLRVTSPYEAVAELLADPPLAMVIDLRCLTPGDLPLIEMARQRSLKVLAVGSVPLGITTTDLSGVCLSARGHLSALLGGLAASPLSDGAPPVCSQAASESADLSSVARSIRKTSHAGRKAAKAPDAARKIADAPAPKAKADDKPLPDSPDELLTREELTALLEDEL